ncbi:MAG: thioredoxin [Fimbriimonadaceae bacterium]|nr:thioredoxin [Fimbriimonadaceae bacterium]
MASELAVTGADFPTKVLQSDVPVLVDFWAAWCGPCLAIGPTVEEIATGYAGKAKVFKVDVDSEQDLAIEHGIQSIPALLLFKDGKVVDRIVGSVPKKRITEMIDKAL